MPRELQWEKKFKTKLKKYNDMSFIPTKLIVGKLLILYIISISKGITNGKFR